MTGRRRVMAKWREDMTEWCKIMTKWREDMTEWREDMTEWREGTAEWREDMTEWHKGMIEWRKGMIEWREVMTEWRKVMTEWCEVMTEWHKGMIEWRKVMAEWCKVIAEWCKVIAEWCKVIAEWREDMAEWRKDMAERRKDMAEWREDMAEWRKDMTEWRKACSWWRKAWSRLRNTWSRFWNGLRAVDAEFEANLEERAATGLEKAHAFAEYLEGKRYSQYGWACQYAKDDYERIYEATKELDAKADSVIQYVGLLAALVTAALIYGSEEAFSLVVSAIPFLVFSMSAIYIALTVRTPTAHPLPPHPKDAVKYVEKYGHAAETVFIGQYVIATTTLEAEAAEKIDKVRRAYRQFAWAVILLCLPWVVKLGIFFWGG